MQQNEKRKNPHREDMRYINFWGGKNLLFTLIVLIMLAILIMLFNQVSFIFRPLQVIFSTIFAPVILAVVFYYLLNPIVSWLEKKGVKRLVGTSIVFIGMILLIVWGFVLLIPILVDQVTELVQQFPTYIESISTRLEEWVSGSIFEVYYLDAMEWLDDSLGDIPKMVLDWLGNSSQKILNVFSTISNVVVVIVTFPIILFFMLLDSGKFKPFIMDIIPPMFRDDIHILGERISSKVGSYIQGLLMVELSLGGLLLVGYLIIGIDYAFVLAVIATVTGIIPYIGATIGIIPAVVIALFTSPFMLLKLAIVWVLSQFIQGNVIEPAIMGKNLKLHPLTIIIVLLILGNLLGLIGLILGIPIFAIFKLIVEYLFEKFKKRYNRYFSEVSGPYVIDRDTSGDSLSQAEKEQYNHDSEDEDLNQQSK